MDAHALGKWLIIAGLGVVLLGIFFLLGGRVPFLGRLPGDILIKRDHFSFYFPITTCIVVSLLFTLLVRFFNHR
jgi:hypothetical protein